MYTQAVSPLAAIALLILPDTTLAQATPKETSGLADWYASTTPLRSPAPGGSRTWKGSVQGHGAFFRLGRVGGLAP